MSFRYRNLEILTFDFSLALINSICRLISVAYAVICLYTIQKGCNKNKRLGFVTSALQK